LSVYFFDVLQRPAYASFQVSGHTPGGDTDFFLLIRYHSDEALSAVLIISHVQSNDAITWINSLYIKTLFRSNAL